ncbi:DUF2179 domain-containing protein [Marinoscillum sp.]|uniref:DUF2179 domain-containing protein n=1 Tax=Marinoscillum sp. TaxID=2024838 RepID=UPI003BAD6A2F
MGQSISEFLGMDQSMYQLVLLPILIFLSRIMDVSINTIRIIFMLQSKKAISTFLGFFESLIWILAISQIFQNITSWPTYLAYASGFASGIFVGMIIEEKLAIGRVVVRVITRQPARELIEYFREKSFRFSSVDATSEEGAVNIIFTVIKREALPSTIKVIKTYNPKAFYTVEGVKKVSDDEILDERSFTTRRIFRR